MEILGMAKIPLGKVKVLARAKKYPLNWKQWRKRLKEKWSRRAKGSHTHRFKGGNMNVEKLDKHVKLCRRNLKSSRVKCCAECPFEDDITLFYPELKVLFVQKRQYLRKRGRL